MPKTTGRNTCFGTWLLYYYITFFFYIIIKYLEFDSFLGTSGMIDINVYRSILEPKKVYLEHGLIILVFNKRFRLILTRPDAFSITTYQLPKFKSRKILLK